MKKGYTPEEAEKIASICRSYYKSIDKMQAELSEKSMKIHEIFNEQSVKKGSWQQKYLTDFDKYVSKCRYCLNSGLDLPDEPLFKAYKMFPKTPNHLRLLSSLFYYTKRRKKLWI